ncbi:MAG: radical SAM protein [Candidatus Omnitrophica bacterium]|nr:radical SAM protein [Candidatus Omnitrophota bacterium]
MVTQVMQEQKTTHSTLSTVYLYFSQYCNLRCRHCWIDPKFAKDKAPKNDDIDIKSIISALEECRQLGMNAVKVTGGEPFLREDVFELLDYCKSKKIHLSFETNGTLIKDAHARALKDARVGLVAVSLDGPNAKIHQLLRGVEDSFDQAVEGIKSLKEYGIHVQVIISLWRNNKDYIKDTIDLSRLLGVNSVKINIISSIARAGKLMQDSEILSVEEVIDFYQALTGQLSKETPFDVIFDIPPAFRFKENIQQVDSCSCGIHGILGILGDGKISICGIGSSLDALVLGKVGQDSIKDIWNNHPILEEIRDKVPYKLEGICGKCSKRYSCLGKCRAEAYYNSKTFVSPFSFCQQAYEQGLFPDSAIKEDLKTNRYIARNNCVISYQDNGVITTCLRKGQDYIKLEGFDVWLWDRLGKVEKLSIAEVESEARKSGISKEGDNVERKIEDLIRSNVVSCVEETMVCNQDLAIDSKKLNKYMAMRDALVRELSSAKNFGKKEDLSNFHQNAVETIDGHFETKEVTASHLLRENNPALGGLNYGAKLFEKVESLKTIEKNARILDVGSGLGFTSRSFLQSLKEKNPDVAASISYILCDLTFKFLKNQKNLTSGYPTRFIQANAEGPPFNNNSFDIILANENIADFTSVKLNKKDVLDFLVGKIKQEHVEDASTRKALEWIKSSSIDVSDALPEFIFNLGAFEFMKQINRLLKAGGLAFVCEYGILRGYPTAVYLPNHTEYTIQFSQLIKCIKSLGMEVEVRSLLDFFDFNKEEEVVDECSLNFVYGIMKKNNINLPYLAYTKEMLEEKINGNLLSNFKNLKFLKIREKMACMNMDTFYVLLIRKKGG